MTLNFPNVCSLSNWKQNLQKITVWHIGDFLMRSIHLAMFAPHVSHEDLPGAEEGIAVFTCVSWARRVLEVCWAITVCFLYWWRLLFSLVLTNDISSIFIISIVIGGVAVCTVGVSWLGAEGEVDAQVWWTLDGLQCSMDDLEMIHRLNWKLGFIKHCYVKISRLNLLVWLMRLALNIEISRDT